MTRKHARSRRLPVGQLFGRALRLFRAELHERAQRAGYSDLREAHLQVFGNLDWTGTRLTDLAARASMTRPSMSELVDELERAGYLKRGPDPADGRAKLISLTHAGKRVMAQAVRVVRDIEDGYAASIGPERFEALCDSLQALIDVAGSADAEPGKQQRR